MTSPIERSEVAGVSRTRTRADPPCLRNYPVSSRSQRRPTSRRVASVSRDRWAIRCPTTQTIPRPSQTRGVARRCAGETRRPRKKSFRAWLPPIPSGAKRSPGLGARTRSGGTRRSRSMVSSRGASGSGSSVATTRPPSQGASPGRGRGTGSRRGGSGRGADARQDQLAEIGHHLDAICPARPAPGSPRPASPAVATAPPPWRLRPIPRLPGQAEDLGAQEAGGFRQHPAIQGERVLVRPEDGGPLDLPHASPEDAAGGAGQLSEADQGVGDLRVVVGRQARQQVVADPGTGPRPVVVAGVVAERLADRGEIRRGFRGGWRAGAAGTGSPKRRGAVGPACPPARGGRSLGRSGAGWSRPGRPSYGRRPRPRRLGRGRPRPARHSGPDAHRPRSGRGATAASSPGRSAVPGPRQAPPRTPHRPAPTRPGPRDRGAPPRAAAPSSGAVACRTRSSPTLSLPPETATTHVSPRPESRHRFKTPGMRVSQGVDTSSLLRFEPGGSGHGLDRPVALPFIVPHSGCEETGVRREAGRFRRRSQAPTRRSGHGLPAESPASAIG